ncbi:hypothetical protein [Variovorax arabinosiphilus]|uniref:hypothetical protein n=1 Tax=Variovorax arabinosiphilus TaxID=3053498 RepID=UPI002577382C|nr:MULTISPECIES: hypothetical protein [unclassified Variovorax]MDM0118855.1 hypothetical protein [Variovorax sp. J2L1-78]MDM0129280.1 hypothetical protein [Variovorax sp. J2L1-63]MDM0232933.1 hypothetical protein [Variovorax sp. J2R1-6]
MSGSVETLNGVLMPHPDGSGRLIQLALWSVLKPQYDARRTQFESGLGRHLETAEGRTVAAAAFMQQEAVHRVEITPEPPKYKGGLTEAQVDRFVANSDLGVTNRHGGEDFPVAESNPLAGPSIKSVSFFGA